MHPLQIFSTADITKYTRFRQGEIKFGERVQVLTQAENCFAELRDNDSKYVLLGIPEDIGVRANFGRSGTACAWESFLSSFLNIQHNRFCKGNQITVLGHLDFSAEMEAAAALDVSQKEDRRRLFKLVEALDKEVSHIVSQIVKANKIPIIIGGGHNNAYGNIKGLALGKAKSVNVINFDAHTDFRPLEGRHSGNGFSYAFEEGFLKHYFIFGLHENYTPKSVFDSIKGVADKVKYNTYEQIRIRKEKSFDTELLAAQKHIDNAFYGIEIDLDSIPNVASSASTPTGFSAERLRQFLHFFGKSKNAAYLHICEGAPALDFEKNSHLVGKLIAYLVTDFIKINSEKI
ncbi:formimidoylglutamase [Flavobacterium sp. JP2137]|uniref:formimidoylglutamase n=1 Tax=Flavobacterium sp. JP2137 TaxID=3414510 RepID=UPI003D3004A2